jgi:hypothetical protein
MRSQWFGRGRTWRSCHTALIALALMVFASGWSISLQAHFLLKPFAVDEVLDKVKEACTIVI